MTALALMKVAAALARRCPAGDIATEERSRTLAQFSQYYPDRYTGVEVQRETVEVAMDLTQRYLLRAHDVIHLSTALQLDQPLRAAAGAGMIFISTEGQLCCEAEGLKGENPDDPATEEEIRGIF